jgi:hypothetical protein
LDWASPPTTATSDTLQIGVLLGRLDTPLGRQKAHFEKIENAANSWLAADISTVSSNGAPGKHRDVDFATECLAWCVALPRLPQALDAQLWWSLAVRLTAIATDPTTSEPLTAQLLHVELPLALAYVLPELESCQTLVAVARDVRDQAEAAMLDGRGRLLCDHLPILRPLLACWTRSGVIERAIDGTSRNSARRGGGKQFAGLLEFALQLSRPNGQSVFSPLASSRWNADFLKTATKLAVDHPEVKRILRLVEQGATSGRSASGIRKDQPASSFESESAGVAVLRPDWSRTAPRLAVAYGSRQVMLELNAGGQCLWSGEWGLQVRFNGRPREVLGNWESIAWEREDGCDYLELEIHLEDEIVVQRHIVLARSAGFLFMADAVLGIQQGTLEYRGSLPLIGCSTFKGAIETREGSLIVGHRPRARVLPLALDEWRSAPARGSLHLGSTGLELTQTAEAQALLAPLFVDLNATRLRREATWRQLTVGQKREIVPREEAVGYRVQVGKLQWLIYRSLAAPEVRTVLGSNLLHEFMVGEFQADGGVEMLLEIEAAK